jgi:hypothetical protein
MPHHTLDLRELASAGRLQQKTPTVEIFGREFFPPPPG